MSSSLTRITLVTETFAPEINGVANTLGHLVRGLLSRGIAVQVIRPGQHKQDLGTQKGQQESQQEPGLTTVILPGLPIPGYNELKFGLPLKQKIRQALTEFQPQAIYVATEGPMGLGGSQSSQRSERRGVKWLSHGIFINTSNIITLVCWKNRLTATCVIFIT